MSAPDSGNNDDQDHQYPVESAQEHGKHAGRYPGCCNGKPDKDPLPPALNQEKKIGQHQ